jgi:hypothetical protein
MRMRPIAAAVVLGLGIVGIALAQKADQPPGPQAGTKAKLRSQIVKHQSELELLQLEHDAARGELLDIMKGIREFESNSMEGRAESMIIGMLRTGDNQGLQKLADMKSRESLDEAFKRANDGERASRDRKKKDYARQAEELAGKRLDLEALVRQYHDTK